MASGPAVPIANQAHFFFAHALAQTQRDPRPRESWTLVPSLPLRGGQCVTMSAGLTLWLFLCLIFILI